MKLRVDVVLAGTLEEHEGLVNFFVLEQFHSAVEGQNLSRSPHGLVGVGDVVQRPQCPFIIAAGHVDLQQKAVGLVAAGG